MEPGKSNSNRENKSKRFQSSARGCEITCVMYGIKNAILNDVDSLEKALLNAANHENFNILDRLSHRFTPQGYTALFLLTESHLAIHTYPEYNSLVFNVYSCRHEKDGVKAFEHFKKAVKPSRVEYRQNRVVIDENKI